MGRATVCLQVVVVCILFVSSSFAYELPLSGKAKVTLAQGQVLLTSNESSKPLQSGSEIQAPSEVQVLDESRLELLLPDGSILRFSQNTQFTLVKAKAQDTKRDIAVDVFLGNCWAKVKGLMEENSSFSVNSPTAVAGVAGTVYRLNVSPDGGSTYHVYQGRIAVGYRPVSPPYSPGGGYTKPHRVQGPTRVEGPRRVSEKQWMVIVASGSFFQITPQGTFEEPGLFDQDADRKTAWVKWNLERDRGLVF